jgi:regulator of replication initiation timing
VKRTATEWAERLEALQAENTALRAENATLRAKLDEFLEAAEACPDPVYHRGNHPLSGDAYDEDFAYWHTNYLKPLLTEKK